MHPGQTAALTTTVVIARQRIEDRHGHVAGVEVLFRRDASATTSDAGWTFDDDIATATVIDAVIGEFGVGGVAGEALLFVNLSRPYLVGERPIVLQPNDVVLEVLERVDADAELILAMDRLHAQGYRFALDDFVENDPRAVLLSRCDYVKVVLGTVEPDRLAAFVARLRQASPHAQMIAERVETAEDYRIALAAGFDLFQGYLVNHPAILHATSLRHHNPTVLRLLGTLLDPNVSTAALAELVVADPAVTRRLLLRVNSAAGARMPVHDPQLALTLIGRAELHGMLVLEMLGGIGYDDPEIPVMALACTRAAQELAPDEPMLAASESLARLCTDQLGMTAADVESWLVRAPAGSRAAGACDALDEYLDSVDRSEGPHLRGALSPLEVSLTWLRSMRDARALVATPPVDD